MARQWNAGLLLTCLALGTLCGGAARAEGVDFTLTPAEDQRVAARQVVIRASLDSSQRRGTVRAAVRIEAPPDIVFQMMIRCSDALKYVPHLRKCRVREHSADGRWMVVEHQVDFGWYAPSVNWAFHADLDADRRITFRHVDGDFRANEGLLQLEPTPDGATTLLLYRAYIDPPAFIPNWLARSTFKRELPQMLTDLRRRCEAEQSLRAQAGKTSR